MMEDSAGAVFACMILFLVLAAFDHQPDTHVAVSGRVAYVVSEADGDVHIKLVSASGRFIVAECIPALPCARPKSGQTITVYGISRQDSEHGWWEVHPVERWQ
jgi:hypothetical protein